MAAGTYRIEGLITNQHTLEGIADLVVVALDIDQPAPRAQTSANTNTDLDALLSYDRLGSVLTDRSGRFKLEFAEEDFRVVNNEPRPDIMLVVLAPEVAVSKPGMPAINALSIGGSIIHVSPVLRLKAGRQEAYSIRVPKEIVQQHRLDRRSASAERDPEVLRKKLEERTENARLAMSAKIDAFTTRLAANAELKQAADNLLSSFSLSTVKESVKERDTYLRPTDDLAVLQERIITNGLTRLGASETRKTMRLRVDRERLIDLGLLDDAGRLRPELPIVNLWRWYTSASEPIVERRRTFATCHREFSESDLRGASPAPAPAAPAEPHDDHHAMASINDMITRQVDCATCPEEPLTYAHAIDPQYRSRDLRNTISGLELVSGPTDVTSYYDFHSIQIAFETIWTEILDDSLGDLAREIFTEVVRTQDEVSGECLMRASDLGLYDPRSLRSLLSEYRNITGGRINSRLDRLFTELEERLADPYKFDVFAADSINYGVVFTYRQKWEPGSYQVGKLVNTVSLGPKEERKYETKVTRKLTKSQKVIEEREFKGSSESQTTSRAESEIVNRATNKTSFSTNAQGTLNAGMYSMQFGMDTGVEAEKFSSSTKKNFREAVLKSAQEYRKETKIEVSVSSEDTVDTTTSGALQNPNDEIAVTYLFYELQRQYQISEQLHRITPVILVAFAVPKPQDIDNDWLMTYAWILNRVLLDEAFRPALDYITQSSTGDQIALQELGVALKKQQRLVDELTRELALKNENTEAIMGRIVEVMTPDQVVNTVKEVGDFVTGLLNPLGSLFGGGGDDDSERQLDRFKEVLELQLERAEKEQQRLDARLRDAVSDLQAATERFGSATQRQFNQQTAIAQLRIHVKENILYYMQAIWDYEPPDQRYFRLYDLEIDWFAEPDVVIPMGGVVPHFDPLTGEIEYVETDITLPIGGVARSKRKLVDVADIDTLLGFKGNYAIFPVKEASYLHLHMMQDYIDTQTGGLRDPDTFADVTTQELIDYLRCVREEQPDVYEAERDDIIQLINERQRAPRRETELVVVPTDSLYLECLPGKHPILEDFKLVHRAIDVKKVQAEVRKLELENLRYAARLLNDDRSDPDIEKVIRIESEAGRPVVET